MGWKGTKEITRSEAIKLIMDRVYNSTDDQLEETLTDLGFGDDTKLPHIGYNFKIVTDNAW